MTRHEVAVVGCGFMGENHAHAIGDHPTLDLSYVVDVDAERAEAVAEAYGATHATTDYEDAVDDVDAVVVATPEQFHAEQARRVLKADRHLLLEKPVTADTEEAWELRDLARGRDVASGVSFILRYDPGYSGAREAVASGELGDPVAIRAHRGITTEESHRIGGRGHPVYYMNIHDIDAMCWTVGSEVETVRATQRVGELTDVDVPDAMEAVFEFENGAIGTLAGYGVLPNDVPGGIDAALRVVGTEGTATVDTPGTTLTVHGDRFDRPDTRHWPVVNDRMDGAVRRQIDRFAGAITGETDLIPSLDDGARAQAIADGMKAAAESDDEQTIDYR